MKRHTLRTIRERRKLSVSELARLTKVHKSIISRIDRGERQPALDTAEQIEKRLGLKPGSILFPKPAKDHGAAA